MKKTLIAMAIIASILIGALCAQTYSANKVVCEFTQVEIAD